MKATGRSTSDFKDLHNPSPQVVQLKVSLAHVEKLLTQEKADHGQTRLLMEELASSVTAAAPPKMVYVEPRKKTSSAITHVLQLTDLHNGEVTKANEVEGFNEFNPAIFDARLDLLSTKVIDITRVKRNGYHIPTLHVLGTGDYISGDIHEELKVTNAYPAPVQAVRAGLSIGATLEKMAPHFGNVVCDFLTCDNHGRLTRKNQSSEGGENNWGFVVAHIVKQYLSRLPNVDVRIHATQSALVPIGSERYLAFHGHQMKGWAGLPYYSFDRRVALEAVKRMGFAEKGFTKLVVGHFHTAFDGFHWMIGGSLSGTNPFDHGQGRHAPAHQTSWLVDPKHGQFDFTRWWLAHAR